MAIWQNPFVLAAGVVGVSRSVAMAAANVDPRFWFYEGKAPNEGEKAFITWLAPIAQQANKQWGVPASACIGQAMHETAYGKSVLAQEANNILGIKAAGSGAGNPWWDDKIFVMKPGGAQWRYYPHAANCVFDYADLMHRVSAYHDALENHALSGVQFVRAIAPTYAPSGAHSLNEGYAAKVEHYIDKHDLWKYDVPPSNWQLRADRVIPGHKSRYA